MHAPGQTARGLRSMVPFVSVLLALVASGCAATDTRGRPAAITLEEFLAGATELVLEENDDVINVWPMVRPDPRGGFLLADMQDHAIPAEHFRRAAPWPPEALGNRQVMNEWVQSFHMTSRIIWLSDGGFLVQYQGFDEGMTPYFNLVRLTREGERVFEFQGSPRLLAVAGDRAFLMDPETELPNHWVVATLP